MTAAALAETTGLTSRQVAGVLQSLKRVDAASNVDGKWTLAA